MTCINNDNGIILPIGSFGGSQRFLKEKPMVSCGGTIGFKLRDHRFLTIG